MSENIRNPKQQRSIDKKKKIIQAGYTLFAEKGYFNTNTAEIAKSAGVSTGIVYGYFHDKKDILIEVVDIYVKENYDFILHILDNLSAPIDFDKVLADILDNVVVIHKKNAGIHEALYSLSSYDSDVNNKFMEFEKSITEKACKELNRVGYAASDITEKVHLSMELIQSFAHECVFDKHTYINYTQMRSLILKVLSEIFIK